MRKMKALSTVLAAALVITGINISPEAVLAAKKPSIGKSAEVKAGETVKIKVKNANGKTKVKWSISNKSKKQKGKVAKIVKQIKKGKKASVTVKGLKEGKAVVTAKFTTGKKKYTKTCTVTVNDPDKVPDATTSVNASATSAAVTGTQVPVTTATATATATVTAGPTGVPADNPTSTPEATMEATSSPETEPSDTPDATSTPTQAATASPDTSSDTTPPDKPMENGFTATFDVDSHASITTYTTQDYTKADGTVQNATTALSRNGDTGAATTDGTGQVNFTVVPAEGYEVDKVEVTPEGKFSNIKGATDTKKADTYRVTKITGDITIKVTTKEKDPDAPVITSYKVEFEVPEHASVTTYRTKAYDDPAVTLTNQTESESWDTDGNPTVNGGQVNFKVIPEEGYEIESVTIDEAYKDMYKNLKTHANSTTDDPIPEGNYRITKIAGDLKVKITVKKSDGGNETPVVPAEYKATFVIEGGHATITTYTTQNYDSAEGVTENAAEAVARDSSTGAVLTDGTGQINFTVVPEEGYEVGEVTVTEGNYGNLKLPADTKKADTYRVTKIKGDIVITVTVKQKTSDAPSEYKVTFDCAEHASITVYKTKDYDNASNAMENQTEAVSRDDNGDPTAVGGQINFKIILDDGYVIDEVTPVYTGDKPYKNMKTNADDSKIPENIYRITQITGDFVVKVTVKAA